MGSEVYTVGTIIGMLLAALGWLIKTHKEQVKALEDRIVKVEIVAATRETALQTRIDERDKAILELTDRLLEAAGLLKDSTTELANRRRVPRP